MTMIMLTIRIHSGLLLPTLSILLALPSALAGSSFPLHRWRTPGHRPGTEDGSAGKARGQFFGQGGSKVAVCLSKGCSCRLSGGPHLYTPAGVGIMCG